MRALYIGYTKGTENHGDEALQWIIRDLLWPQVEVRRDWQEYEIALLGGGTLINQSPWLIDTFDAALSRASVGGIVFGSGVGDLAFWGNHFERWVPLLERCSHVGVRGYESQALLEQHGYHKAVVCGDPYLWLHPPVSVISPVYKHLGVNLGSTNNSLWGQTDEALEEIVSEALGILQKRGWTFTFLSVWSKDLPMLQKMADKFGRWGSSPCYDARTQTLEAYSAVARCDLFLGEKLHACAMAAIASVPFIAMEYQPKVRDFTGSLGMEEWTVSTAGLTPEKIVELIEDLHSQRPRVRARLTCCLASLRQKLTKFTEDTKQRVPRLQYTATR